MADHSVCSNADYRHVSGDQREDSLPWLQPTVDSESAIFALLDDDDDEEFHDGLREDDVDEDDDDDDDHSAERAAAPLDGGADSDASGQPLPDLSMREWAHLCSLLDPRGSTAPEALPPSLREDALAEHPLALCRGSGARGRSAWDVLVDGRGMRLALALQRRDARVAGLITDDGGARAISRQKEKEAAEASRASWGPPAAAFAYSPALLPPQMAVEAAALALATFAARQRQAALATAAASAAGAPQPSLYLAMALLRTVFDQLATRNDSGSAPTLPRNDAALTGLLGAAASTLATGCLFDLCGVGLSPEGLPGSAAAPVGCATDASLQMMQRLVSERSVSSSPASSFPASFSPGASCGANAGSSSFASDSAGIATTDAGTVGEDGAVANASENPNTAGENPNTAGAHLETRRRLASLELLLWIALRAGSTEAALRAATAARDAIASGALSPSHPISPELALALTRLKRHPQLALQPGVPRGGLPLRTWSTPALRATPVVLAAPTEAHTSRGAVTHSTAFTAPPTTPTSTCFTAPGPSSSSAAMGPSSSSSPATPSEASPSCASVELWCPPSLAAAASAASPRHGCGPLCDTFHGDPSRGFHFWVYPRGAPLVTPHWETHEGPTDFCSNCRYGFLCSADGSTHTESNKLYRKVKHRARPNLPTWGIRGANTKYESSIPNT